MTAAQQTITVAGQYQIDPTAGIVRIWPAPLFAFVAYGIPGPQGSKKAVGMRNGHAVLVESSKKVKPWRDAVTAAARAALPDDWTPLTGPLAVEMLFTMPRPGRVPAVRQGWPAATPDLSKLCRATEDALSPNRKTYWPGVWADDALVVEYRRLAEVYEGSNDRDVLPAPGVVVRIWSALP